MSGRPATKPPGVTVPEPAEAEARAPEPSPAANEPALDEASRELLDHLIEVTWQRCLRDLRDTAEPKD